MEAKYDPDEFFNRKKPTNADKIRQMSDAELADIITDDWCEMLNCKSPCDGNCDLKVLTWLQQEVEK
jgi:hypothetical protein